jgi:glucosylceramidase
MKHNLVSFISALSFALSMSSCTNQNILSDIEVFETAENGHQLKKIETSSKIDSSVLITINPEKKYQTITGIGGSFTEASASLLNKLSPANRSKILEAYFGDSGARYSLTRTHINSCDFSLSNYSYAPVAGDTSLTQFSIKEDMDDIIPLIKDAMAISKEGFRIIASPWTAPPWMKDNKDWRGGKLLPQYYDTWALFFSKYIDAYKKEGINIWGVTVENEPLGNNNNWESMHYTPQEMNEFVKKHLGPKLKSDSSGVKILGYDQNRDEELKKWVDVMYDDKEAAEYFDGTAIHWYASTYDYFPDALQYAHQKAPGKYLIQTEACVDAEVPKWKDDKWYWSKEATDWGWDWATPETKHLHPKYVPVHRYARDIIGCLNNHVDGWIDWNMVLNKQGGPNWFKNWCTAPVIVDVETDEVYFTPLYYTMAHFSRYIRPEAVRIASETGDAEVMTTAVKNPDGSIAVVIFNPGTKEKSIQLNLNGSNASWKISGNALQTIVIPAKELK